MKKMNAITFKRTHHILGVVTRTSQPDSAVKVEDIAGDGFRLRSINKTTNDEISLEIPEGEVGVALVNYDTRVLYQPHLFVIEDDKATQNTQLPDPPNLVLDGTAIEVILPDNVSSSTDVWCLIFGKGLREPIKKSITIKGTVDNPTDKGTEKLDLNKNEDYDVAVFAPGYALAVFTKTVPP